MSLFKRGLFRIDSEDPIVTGKVDYYADLPSAANNPEAIYYVLNNSLLTLKFSGAYSSNGVSWTRLTDLTTFIRRADVVNNLISTDTDKPLSANQGKLLQDTKLADVIEDTTPQLGGNLDINSNNITGTGNIDINGEIEANTLIGDLRGVTEFQAKAGEDITKGDPLYISNFDVSGNKPIVGIADADDSNKMPCFGLAKDTASNNSNVNVVTFGTLAGLNTSSFTLGDILYISTSGALTNIKPAGESTKIQNIGKVQRVHTSNGSIKVGGAGRTNDVPNLNLGNVFIGNSSNQAETRGLTLDDISETATYKLLTTTNNTKLNNITLNQSIDLDTVLFNVAINNLKITNATHTGDVTGSTALTITDQAVTDAKLSHIATGTVKGRTTAGTGAVENIIIDTDLTTVSSNDDTLASAKAIKTYVDNNSGSSIADESVTNPKLAHISTNTVKGRLSAGTGDVEDITVTALKTAINVTKGDIGLSSVQNINVKNDWSQNSGKYIASSEIRAKDSNGLKLHDDGGSGIFVKDGGNIGVGNSNPATKLVLEGANTKVGNGITFRADQGSGATDRLSMYAEHGSTFTFNQPADGAIRFADHSDVDIFHISTWLQRVGVMNNNPRQKLSVGADLGSSIGAFGLGVQDAVVTGSANSNSVIGIQNWGSGSKLFSYNYGASSAVAISIQPDNANVYICQGGGNVGIGTTSPSQRLHVNGNAVVSGSLSKGSGSFDIPHPNPKKTETHRLRHYFVETPSAGGNIYKYQIKCKKGKNYIDLPDYFKYLTKDSLVWVNPVKHFGRAWGEVKKNGKKVKIVTDKKGTYNILIFGDRKDETAMKDFNEYGIEYKNKK